MKTKLAFALALTLALGCKPSPMGTKVDWETVKQFTPGISTAVDIVGKLGPATLISKAPDNSAKFMWTYLEPKNLHEVEIQTVELIFDSNLKLVNTPGNKVIKQPLSKSRDRSRA